MADLSRFRQQQAAAMGAKEKKDKGHERKLNWKEKRYIKKEKQQKEEEEQITKGVSSAIPSTNIGFKMLQQMGYNPGLALGKHGQGRLEPVGIEIKRSRTGLGRDEVVKEIKTSKAKEMERNTQEKRIKVQDMMSDYGERQKQLWHSRKIMANYKKARAALAHLEGANSIPDRDETENIQEEDVDEAEEDEEEDEVIAEKTRRGNGYRRKLNGKEKGYKRKIKGMKREIKTEKQQKEEEEQISKELQEIINRLRTEFNYCIYCGCQYESADVMLSNCPGVEEDDH